MRRYRYGAPVCKATKEGKRCVVNDCKRAHPLRCLDSACYPKSKEDCEGWHHDPVIRAKPGKPGNGNSPASSSSPASEHHKKGKAGAPKGKGKGKGKGRPKPSPGPETQMSQVIEVLRAVKEVNAVSMPSNSQGALPYAAVVQSTIPSQPLPPSPPPPPVDASSQERMLSAMKELMQQQMQMQANLQKQMQTMLQNLA